MQRELTRTLKDAPAPVITRFREMRPPPPEVGSPAGANHYLTAYPPGLQVAVTILQNLAEPSAERVAYRPEDLAATVLDWLTSAVGQAVVSADGSRVSSSDVELVRTMISAIDTIERRAGGAECRATARRYLHDVALPMLQREIQADTRSDLFSAVAELCEIVGWMYYDAGQHGAGQAYFTQALRLAHEVGDHALSAYLMTSITHQALHVGQAGAALRVAKAARNVAESAGSPQVLVEADLLLARSHAQAGAVGEATTALRWAEQSYEQIQSAETRTWEPQWDEIMFASHAGTCWNDLGNTQEARRHLTQVWERSGDRPRRRIYSAAELGIAATREGELELACHYGTEIISLSDNVDSNRAQRHLERLAAKLKPFKATHVVRSFFDQSGLNPESVAK